MEKIQGILKSILQTLLAASIILSCYFLYSSNEHLSDIAKEVNSIDSRLYQIERNLENDNKYMLDAVYGVSKEIKELAASPYQSYEEEKATKEYREMIKERLQSIDIFLELIYQAQP